MPFSAKFSTPPVTDAPVPQSVWDHTLNTRLTLFVAPPGYLLMEGLVSSLNERGRSAAWLRLEEADRDPAMFLLSLVEAARRVNPACGARAQAEMRRSPGPTAGWPSLFATLGRDLGDTLPVPCVIVLENVDRLDATSRSLDLLTSYILPELPPTISLILTAQKLPERSALPGYTVFRGIRDVYVDGGVAEQWGRTTVAEEARNLWQRLADLTDGRAEALFTLGSAARVLSLDLIQQIVKRAGRNDDVLRRVASAWYSRLDPPAQRSLALASRVEYVHEDTLEGSLHSPAIADYSCLQPLGGGWFHTRAVWQTPIRAIIPDAANTNREGLRRAAHSLAAADAIDGALRIYVSMDDHDSAAKVVSEAIDTLMTFGAWATLSDWLDRLPDVTLSAFPWLLYTRGEIGAAQGEADDAIRTFARAAGQFALKGDYEGACQSLLAESTVAAWKGDMAHAQMQAEAAEKIAETRGLTWYQGWSNWQLGCLAAEAGRVDDAVLYLTKSNSASNRTGDDVMARIVSLTEALVYHQRNLRRQREYYRQAYLATERAELETIERLRMLLRAPLQERENLLMSHRWLESPLMLKLTAPAPASEAEAAAPQGGLWSALLGALGLRRQPKNLQPPGRLDEGKAPPLPSLVSLPMVAELPLVETNDGAPNENGSLSVPMKWPADSNDSIPAPSAPGQPAANDETDSSIAAAATPILQVHLMGKFSLSFAGQPIEPWPSGRARAVFKYLAANHAVPVSKDILMDMFWPDATPKAARNSLNVALHSLRRTLRTVTDIPLVVYDDNAYGITPDVELWLDADEFEERLEHGRALDSVGEMEAAVAEYERAANLYHGDFLADDPYEEWPIQRRERLRLAYLETLDRLSDIYFARGQYGECIRLCALVLDKDNCREDAHCRVMRCYSRQGQERLALQQYQRCAEALRKELDVEPSPATTQLFERIRQRHTV